MKTEKSERSLSAWWLAAGVVALLTAGAAASRALDVSQPGLALGVLLAALGLRLWVMADAVRDPTAAPGALPASGRRPERLLPAHV